jgi:hypothetical protein
MLAETMAFGHAEPCSSGTRARAVITAEGDTLPVSTWWRSFRGAVRQHHLEELRSRIIHYLHSISAHSAGTDDLRSPPSCLLGAGVSEELGEHTQEPA